MKQKVLFIILNEYTDWEGAFLSTALHVGVIPGGEIKYEVHTLPLQKTLFVPSEVLELYPIILLRICRKIMPH